MNDVARSHRRRAEITVRADVVEPPVDAAALVELAVNAAVVVEPVALVGEQAVSVVAKVRGATT